MLETPCPLPDPQDSCLQIMWAVRSTQETPLIDLFILEGSTKFLQTFLYDFVINKLNSE